MDLMQWLWNHIWSAVSYCGPEMPKLQVLQHSSDKGLMNLEQLASLAVWICFACSETETYYSLVLGWPVQAVLLTRPLELVWVSFSCIGCCRGFFILSCVSFSILSLRIILFSVVLVEDVSQIASLPLLEETSFWCNESFLLDQSWSILWHFTLPFPFFDLLISSCAWRNSRNTVLGSRQSLCCFEC